MTSKIILLRHAKAIDRTEWNDKGLSDQSRPLTDRGTKQFIDSLESIKQLVPKIDLIISSQWARAISTAKLLKKEYSQSKLIKHSSLNPESKETQMIQMFEKHKKNKIICLVGHQPDLTFLLCLLLNQPLQESYSFKKGGLALIEKKQGHWRLETFISPKGMSLVKARG